MKRLFINVFIFSTVTLVPFQVLSNGDNSAKYYEKGQYPSNEYNSTTKSIAKGKMKATITQVSPKNIEKQGFTCRAWITLYRDDEPVENIFFKDIDPVGSSYGIFVPEIGEELSFYPIIKIGDYDSRMFLLGYERYVPNIFGGPFFVTEDKRFIIIQHLSDIGGIEVFDLVEGVSIIKSEEYPFILNWYKYAGGYCFNSEDSDSHIRQIINSNTNLYCIDLKKKVVEKVRAKKEDIPKLTSIKFNYDPRLFSDCLFK